MRSVFRLITRNCSYNHYVIANKSIAVEDWKVLRVAPGVAIRNCVLK